MNIVQDLIGKCFTLNGISIVIFILVMLKRFIDNNGYVIRNLLSNFLLSISLSFVCSVYITDSEPSNNRLYFVNLIGNLSLLTILLLVSFTSIQLFREFCSSKSVLKYVHSSVKNNNIDDCIWNSCLTGKLVKIITKFNEQYIVFPKYSSSFECKIISKKYLRAFVLKKGKVNNNGVEYYEDNTEQILNKLAELEMKNHIYNFIFEPEDVYLVTCHDCCQLSKSYPIVPFYQVLSEYEERIDFKDIVSISIIHLQNSNFKSSIDN